MRQAKFAVDGHSPQDFSRGTGEKASFTKNEPHPVALAKLPSVISPCRNLRAKSADLKVALFQ